MILSSDFITGATYVIYKIINVWFEVDMYVVLGGGG